MHSHDGKDSPNLRDFFPFARECAAETFVIARDFLYPIDQSFKAFLKILLFDGNDWYKHPLGFFQIYNLLSRSNELAACFFRQAPFDTTLMSVCSEQEVTGKLVSALFVVKLFFFFCHAVLPIF